MQMMNPYTAIKENIHEIEKIIGVSFNDRDLLLLAFIHRSFLNEYRHLALEHNERMEFLGDSVLGLLLAEILYHKFPNLPEGELSSLKSQLVDEHACARYFRKLNLQGYILLGKGEELSKGREKNSILANVFEALIAAVFLEKGFMGTKKFLIEKFSDEMEKMLQEPSQNFKAQLQDYSQKNYQKPPTYKLVKEIGPDHAKSFFVAVLIDEKEMGSGSGASKKEAEQKAAKDALQKMDMELSNE